MQTRFLLSYTPQSTTIFFKKAMIPNYTRTISYQGSYLRSLLAGEAKIPEIWLIMKNICIGQMSIKHIFYLFFILYMHNPAWGSAVICLLFLNTFLNFFLFTIISGYFHILQTEYFLIFPVWRGIRCQV